VAYIELNERVGVVPGGVNVGVVRGESGRAIMIDTGINETNGKKALKSIREETGADVAAIVTTHGHADHFGANAVVVKRTGAKVYAPTIDEVFLKYPIFQPSLLFGGGDPLDSLRSGFLLADPSPVDEVYDAGTLTIDGVEFTVLDLGGHSPGQKGFIVDGFFFCADVVLPETVLAKYRIPYLYSVTQHLVALEVARTQTYAMAQPGHGPMMERLDPLIDLNLDLIHRVSEAIVDLLAEPATAEQLLTNVFERFDAPIADASSFYLLQPTVFAFLSHLEREGAISHEIDERRSIWRRA
jgi:glyoxylase-like metal-dependent hydrolase (beta-lactamase superfamily II)